MVDAKAERARVGKVPYVTAILFRLGVLIVIALLVGWVLNRTAVSFNRNDSAPAGFAKGVIQGALMPMALPHFLLGRDIQIYSSNNTGVSYKLGYTAGVNACGAIFFSFLFWRLRRISRWAEARRAR